ncbi:MAG: GNAT family N-acetyltransferase [Thiomonas sp.]
MQPSTLTPPPLGAAVPHWTPPPAPGRQPLLGQFCTLEPADAQRHAADLFAAYSMEARGDLWAYLPYGPFGTQRAYAQWMQSNCGGLDPLFFAIVDHASGKALGLASYLRITPAAGSIEIGHLAFSPLLQRRRAATEALYLLMREAFALGYRRLEWKCNALNAASRQAAIRLGFTFEGVFRQAAVVKGRNRDTAWFSIIDCEWPTLDAAFAHWLAPDNFDENGQQRERLSALTAAALGSDRAGQAE